MVDKETYLASRASFLDAHKGSQKAFQKRLSEDYFVYCLWTARKISVEFFRFRWSFAIWFDGIQNRWYEAGKWLAWIEAGNG